MVAALVLAAGCNGGSAVIGGGDKEDAKVDTGTPEVGDTGDTAAGDTDTGLDPLDEDADEDGYTPREGDCDDTLPHVYPGAPDYCDGLDQDCDGEPIPNGSCGEEGDVAAMWTWSFESDDEQFGGVLSSAGDVDGDGRTDLQVERYLTDPYQDEAGVFYGAQLDGLPAVNPLPALQWEKGGAQWSGCVASSAGDVDADGFDDVWTSTRGGELFTGAIFLHYGTGEMMPATGEDQQDAAAAYWYDSATWTMTSMLLAGDWNGDGRGDTMAALLSADDQPNRWSLLTDAAVPQRANHLEDLPALVDDLHGYGEFANAGDLDGDGFDELVNLLQDKHDGLWLEVAIVEGEDFVDGALVSEVAHRAWYETAAENDLTTMADRPGADLDGDGLVDLALQAYEPGGVVLFHIGGVPDGALNPGVWATVSEAPGDNLWPIEWGADVDADGREDLKAGQSFIPMSALGEGGAYMLGDLQRLRHAYTGGVNFQALTDMTGDGRAEWVFYEQYWQATGATVRTGRSLIVEGFDIPWEDPSKW